MNTKEELLDELKRFNLRLCSFANENCQFLTRNSKELLASRISEIDKSVRELQSGRLLDSEFQRQIDRQVIRAVCFFESYAVIETEFDFQIQCRAENVLRISKELSVRLRIYRERLPIKNLRK